MVAVKIVKKFSFKSSKKRGTYSLVILILECFNSFIRVSASTPFLIDIFANVCLLWRALHKRHTHATILNELEVSDKIIQLRLGHSTIYTTLDIYTHDSLENQIKELEKI